jgi:hypothetical protein
MIATVFWSLRNYLSKKDWKDCEVVDFRCRKKCQAEIKLTLLAWTRAKQSRALALKPRRVFISSSSHNTTCSDDNLSTSFKTIQQSRKLDALNMC